MLKFAAVAIVLLVSGMALAQDVVGLENCSAEKSLERRTGCLQSNNNYLYQLISKNAADAQQRLSAANTEIATLKASVAQLQASVVELRATAKRTEEALKKVEEAAKKAEAAKAPGAPKPK
jgi:predicted  nucleic acid-binding Zn-ribbon protein